ncbi:aldehyde dehydrogenase family protein [Patulibacter sp. NPDC049589]|uniref:aldehyde dehydrogenase family protein n=1 Tax=Patulibacter sp. NPDC049589 TaxID=3154731 RepID=UPI00342E4217
MSTVSVTHHPLFVDGRHVDTTDRYDLHDPATGALVATLAKGTVADVDAAVDAARRSFESGVWSRRDPQDRAAVMTRIADRLGEEIEELAELEGSVNGATIRQALAFHAGWGAPNMQYFADLAASYAFQRTIGTVPHPTLSSNKLVRDPIGVCAAIVPWNFPLLLGIWKIGPALAAGNSVVVKVDERAPLTLLRLAEIAHEVGLPAGVLNVVAGEGPEVGARLASHPDVGKVAFTGSTVVGREIMRLASGTVKNVSLELGGKAPVIVLDDADLDMAVEGILFGCMLFSGQMCESGTRLLVPAARRDEIVARLVARVGDLRLGDPRDFDTDVGPVISVKQRDRALALIGGAVAEGATIAVGGGVPDVPGFAGGSWIEPTILTDVTNDMEIARVEVFGPVLAVLTYETEEEAIRIANDSDYGLTAGVWGGDLEHASEVGGRLRAGSIWINTWHAVDVMAPFGGYGQSGVGRELGPDALDAYTEVKHVHLDLSRRADQQPFELLQPGPGA